MVVGVLRLLKGVLVNTTCAGVSMPQDGLLVVPEKGGIHGAWTALFASFDSCIYAQSSKNLSLQKSML